MWGVFLLFLLVADCSTWPLFCFQAAAADSWGGSGSKGCVGGGGLDWPKGRDAATTTAGYFQDRKSSSSDFCHPALGGNDWLSRDEGRRALPPSSSTFHALPVFPPTPPPPPPPSSPPNILAAAPPSGSEQTHGARSADGSVYERGHVAAYGRHVKIHTPPAAAAAKNVARRCVCTSVPG